MIKPGYAFRQAFRQIARNGAMTSASLFSITAMLLILGLFFTVVVNVNMVAESAKSQFDIVQIYLLDDIAEQSKDALLDKLEDMEEVDGVAYIAKEDAMERFKKRWGDNASLLEGLERNPLPNAIEVKLKDISFSDVVVGAIQNDPAIEEIRYSKTVVDKLVKITGAIQVVSLVLIIILIVVSTVVVSNTIKLTVIAREREINIMKYIGATNWFIRGPFLVEGIMIGLMAALISAGLITGIYIKIVSAFSHTMSILLSVGMVPQQFLLTNLLAIFVALGISIGAIGSTMSMRKFLDT